MGASLFVASVLVAAGWLALELGVSTAITEILAGVALAAFVDVTPMAWLGFLAEFGMLGLMFLAGFEVDPSLLRRAWRASVGIGLVSFVVPMAGVYAAARWGLGFPPAVAGLVGIGLSTTSLALVYHFLRERGLLSGETGQAILGAAMVVDLASMVALALVFGNVGWATLLFVVVALPAFRSLPALGQRLFTRYRGNVVEFEMRVIFLLLVGLGFLAEHAGIHAAIAGFVAGLVLSEIVAEHGALEEKLKGVVFSFFAPVFFLKAGTQLDLGGLDRESLAATGVLLVVAVGLKYGATALAARRVDRPLGHFTGVLFNYRLTFGIITATVGLRQGLLDGRLFSAMLLVILLSALLPMLLLRDLPAELDR